MKIQIMIILSILFFNSCSHKIAATDEQKAQALNNLNPSKSNHKVFYFHSVNGIGHHLNLWIDKKKVCTFHYHYFCRVELAYGPHYLQYGYFDDLSVESFLSKKSWSQEKKDWYLDYTKMKLFVSEEKNGPVYMSITARPTNHPKYNEYIEVPFSDTKILFGNEIIKEKLSDEPYTVPAIPIISTTYATEEDEREWQLYSKTNSVESLKKFINANDKNIYTLLAKKRLKKIDKKEEAKFKKIMANPTLKSLDNFLETNPAKSRKEAAIVKLEKFLKTSAKRREYAKKYPSLISILPAKDRIYLELLNVGPDKLKVKDIKEILSSGFDESTLAAKIRATQARYKNFSFEEIKTLNEMGLSSKIVNAMLETNTSFEAALKRTEENKQMMNKIRELISNSQQEISASQIKQSPNTPIECLKQKAALKACDSLSGFFKIACETTAKSSFECSL